MPASHFILLIESDPSWTEKLSAQLVRIGVEPIRVAGLAEAVETVKSKQYAISAVLLPSDLPGKIVHKALKSMRRREPVLPAMAYGKVPDSAQRRKLREAGVLLALWDGYDEGVLRFQINRLAHGEHQAAQRASRRAPVHNPVRVFVGGREKPGVLYSIAEGGCFIETPRASMDGARIRVTFSIDDLHFELDGTVAFANVPGNLQRPNLPLGMGVHFTNVPSETSSQLNTFIQNRIESLEV